MKSSSIVFIIEPVYHGLQYVDILERKGIKYVIIERHNGPYKIEKENMDNVIYDDMLDAESIAKKIETYLHKNEYSYKGILPGNDFCVPIAFAVAEKLGFKSNRIEAGIFSRNKELMRKQLYKHNVDQPKSKSYKSIEELNEDEFMFPVVVKPSDMTGSVNVQLVYSRSELLDVAKRILNLKDNILGYNHNNIVMVEEFVEGPEFSTELFLEQGKLVFASVTEKQKGELPYFVEIGHVVPSSITTSKENKLLIEAGYKAARAIKIYNGPVHAEMVSCDGKAKIIELTARIGGDNIMKLINLATGVSIPELAIEQCLGKKIDNIHKKEEGAAIRFITANPGIFVGCDLNKLENNNIVEIRLDVDKGMRVNKLKCSDDRLGYVIATGISSHEAKEQAKIAVENLNIKIK